MSIWLLITWFWANLSLEKKGKNVVNPFLAYPTLKSFGPQLNLVDLIEVPPFFSYYPCEYNFMLASNQVDPMIMIIV